MKLKIIMDSGKEYITEKFDNIPDLFSTLKQQFDKGLTLQSTFMTLDEEENVIVKVGSISSIEAVNTSNDSKIGNYEDDDSIVMY
ncbi:hypothetical protein P8847_20450 [Bacillus inaquosorum]|nr:hypothetical protein [Bacillus inaquosorum]